jgi:RNA polymerase sigma factor (sigma-70 family)
MDVPAGGGRGFPATRHTMVAGLRSADPEVKRAGQDTLVSAYWKPVYKYLRMKWSATAVDAQDLTQEFFMRALEKGFFESYEPAKGRFRTFLRTCLDGFMSNQRKGERRLKRGGGVLPVALDFDDAERELDRHAVVDDTNAEAYFHREWIRSVLGQTVDSLREDYARQGKALQFRIFERYDLKESEAGSATTYAQVAGEFGVSASDVTNYLAAARRSFRRALIERFRTVCESEAAVEREIRDLLLGDVR